MPSFVQQGGTPSSSNDDGLLVAFRHDFRPLDIHLQQADQAAASHSKNMPPNPIIHDAQGLPTKLKEPNILDALTVDNLHVSEELLRELHKEHEHFTDDKSPRAIAYWWHC